VCRKFLLIIIWQKTHIQNEKQQGEQQRSAERKNKRTSHDKLGGLGKVQSGDLPTVQSIANRGPGEGVMGQCCPAGRH